MLIEAKDAIHEAMHRSGGIDLYDGQAMHSELLGVYDNAESKERGARTEESSIGFQRLTIDMLSRCVTFRSSAGKPMMQRAI